MFGQCEHFHNCFLKTMSLGKFILTVFVMKLLNLNFCLASSVCKFNKYGFNSNFSVANLLWSKSKKTLTSQDKSLTSLYEVSNLTIYYANYVMYHIV